MPLGGAGAVAAASLHGHDQGGLSCHMSSTSKLHPGAESFEAWQTSLFRAAGAGNSDGVVSLSMMPPKAMRVMEGIMEKKAIASSGVKWQVTSNWSRSIHTETNNTCTQGAVT